MTRDELYSEIIQDLPSSYGDDLDFREHVKKLFYNYKANLNRLDSNSRLKNWNKILRKIDTITNGLLGVIDLTYSGLHSQAHRKFKQISYLNQLKHYQISPSTNWYRVRSFEKKQNLTQKDMFHIPLNKRGIVKTQRYSSIGYPCLYLGSSIYICWEELHRPDLNHCFASRVVNQRELDLYDMTIPKSNSWEIDKHNQDPYSSVKPDKTSVKPDMNFYNDLIRMPLLLSSMIKVKNDNDVFKPEYIIPQQIMETIIEMNHDPNNTQERPVIGIIYSTVLQNEDFFLNQLQRNEKQSSMYDIKDLRFNAAIPIQNPDCIEFCDQLTKIFTITRPTCEEFERAKRQLLSNDSLQYIVNDYDYDYENSIFGLLESRLKNEKRFKLIDLSKQELVIQGNLPSATIKENKNLTDSDVLRITDDSNIDVSIKDDVSETKLDQKLNLSSSFPLETSN